MEKAKVLIITNYPSPYRIPLFEKIAKKVDLYVYFTMVENDRNWDLNLQFKFKYKILRYFNLKIKGKDILNYHFNPSIFKELLFNDYDIVISGGYSSLTSKIALLICKLQKIPFILWSGSTLYESSNLRKLAMPAIKLFIKSCDAFIVYGSRAKEYIMSFNIPEEKIFVAINVGDVSFFSKENKSLKGQKNRLLEENNIKTKRNILFVGRLIPIKGVKYLIAAFKELKNDFQDLGLLIIGTGPLKHHLCEISKNYKDIKFIGFVQPHELPIYYKMADVFVLPSTYELFSIVISEAMASGLPIVTTITNGASEDLIINNVNGFIIEKKSSEEIYLALSKILSDENIKRDMGHNSKKFIEEKFNLDTTAEGFFYAFDYLLNRHRI